MEWRRSRQLRLLLYGKLSIIPRLEAKAAAKKEKEDVNNERV